VAIIHVAFDHEATSHKEFEHTAFGQVACDCEGEAIGFTKN
jgi:hypothetical protein